MRRTLEASLRNWLNCQLTRVARPRQLRDEDLSGGNQPTDIRVIHLRLLPVMSAARTDDVTTWPPINTCGVERSVHIGGL